MVLGSAGGSGSGLEGPAAAALFSSSASRSAKASSSSMLGCAGNINGDDTRLTGRDAEERGTSREARDICEESGDSDEGSGVGNETDGLLEGIVEGPASRYGSGIPKGDACFIDSSIALARSSSSLETFTERSFRSFSERAIARARSFSSS